MIIDPKKLLPSSKTEEGVKITRKNISTSSFLSPKSIKNLGLIKVKIIQIESILKGTLASEKKALDEKKRKESSQRREKQEEKLETKPNKEKSDIKLPQTPKLGIFDWIKNFIGNIILGYFAVRLVEHLPKIIPIIKFIGAAADFVIDVGGKLLDGLSTFIDWGYKAYDATSGFVKNLFGQEGVKQFEQLSSLLNKFLNLALIAGMVAASGGFGGGKRGKPGTNFRPGQGGRPKVTSSGGGRAGGIDLRNPLRQRPKVTSSGGGRAGEIDLRNPLRQRPKITSGGTPKGGAKLAFKTLRPFLKRIPVPVIGALIDFGISWALGENPGRAAFRAIGAGILGWVGGALGGAIGLAGGPLALAGAAIGGIAGGVLGDMAGGALYDVFFGGKTPSKSKTQKRAGGGITRGGRSRGGVKRTISIGKKGKYKRKLAPRKPGEVEMDPGADVGGEDKLFGLFPNPLKMAQKAIDIINPFKVIENTGKNLGKSDYFGPILAITSKILLGQKPSQRDYQNVGLGINLLLYKGISEGKLKGGVTAAFAEGGLVDPQALSAVTDGGDISDWVAGAFKDSTETNSQKTLREIQENLRLKKSDETSPTPTTGGPGGIGGQYSPEGIQGDIYKYLLSKGMDDYHALGIMANISRESGFRPGVSQTGGPGVGLFQYSSAGRKDAFLKAVPNYATNWKGQIDYALKEDAAPQYLQMKFSSPQEAADWWMRKWERPAEYIQNDKGPKIHAKYLASIEKYKTQKGYQIPTSADISSIVTGGKLKQYITGDRTYPSSYDKNHDSIAGVIDNYHDHLAFSDRQTATNAFNFFKNRGFKVTEFLGYDYSSSELARRHGGPDHPAGLAFDIPGSQWGGKPGTSSGPKEYAGSAKVRATLNQFLGEGGSKLKSYHTGSDRINSKETIAKLLKKESVLDVDTSESLRKIDPQLIGQLNRATSPAGIMRILQSYATYEDGADQTVMIIDSPSANVNMDDNYGDIPPSIMFMSGEEESDPFATLYRGG